MDHPDRMTGHNSAGSRMNIQPPVEVLIHLIEVKQWDRLLQMARQRLEQSPTDEPGHRSAALALIHLRRLDDASVHVKTLLGLDPAYYYHHELAGRITMQQMKLEWAKEHLSRALSLNADNASTHRLMATVLASLGESRLAQHHADVAHQLDGDTVESWQTREVVIEAHTTGTVHWKERIMLLEKALERDPEDAFLLWRVGSLLQALERTPAAERWLAKAVAADPLCPVVIGDWREAYERKNLIYRCLSYPWRKVRGLLWIIKNVKDRPEILFPQILAFKLWIGMLIWWLATWVTLAPVGLVWRYFMVLHPAFDLRWLPRRWLYGRNGVLRFLLMAGTLSGLACGLYLLISPDFHEGYMTLFLVQLGLNVFVTASFIGARWTTAPRPPKAWLSTNA